MMLVMDGWDRKRAATSAGEVMSTMREVVGEGSMSIPRGVKPREGRDSIRALPR